MSLPGAHTAWSSEICIPEVSIAIQFSDGGWDPPRPNMSRPNRPGRELKNPVPGMPGTTPGVGVIIGIPIPIIIMGFIIIIGFIMSGFMTSERAVGRRRRGLGGL